MPKALSESPKNLDKEEQKEPISKVGLNQDMLLKLDQQNMIQGNTSEFQNHGPMLGYYATPSIISATSNNTNAKTARPKKAAKMMPNKKYLVEMKPITVLVKLMVSDIDSGYVKCQVKLSQDCRNADEITLNSDQSSKALKFLENCSEIGASKDCMTKVTTPIRTNRTMSIESTDHKTDCKTNNASTAKDT